MCSQTIYLNRTEWCSNFVLWKIHVLCNIQCIESPAFLIFLQIRATKIKLLEDMLDCNDVTVSLYFWLSQFALIGNQNLQTEIKPTLQWMKYIKSVPIKSVRYSKSFTELVLLQNVFDMLLFIPALCVIALRNILLFESD